MKIKNFVSCFLVGLSCLSLGACQSLDEEAVQPIDEAEVLDYSRFDGKVKIMERTANSITYEYSDVRVDQVSTLASQYCQILNGQKAYLDKVILYKNNARRAKFYCYK